MSQNIEFEKVVVDRVIVKMGRDNIGRHIICRVLDGSEGVDVFTQWQNDDSTRMLAGTAADTGTARQQALDLTVALGDPFIFKIMFHIAVGGLVGHGRYGACLEGLLVAENDLGVGVGFGLVFSGEVEVDIRFLIPLEAQEGLERNIKTILVKLLSAVGALAAGHIDSALTLVFHDQRRVKIGKMAVCAVIMRRQGIDFCDS